jgi:hypothetical protein
MTEELAPMADSEFVFKKKKKKGPDFYFFVLFDFIMNVL